MEPADDRLRAAGMRVTRPHLAVMAEVASHPHVSVETITAGVRWRLGRLSRQAVHDRACYEIVNVECDTDEPPLLQASHDAGCLIDEAEATHSACAPAARKLASPRP